MSRGSGSGTGPIPWPAPGAPSCCCPSAPSRRARCGAGRRPPASSTCSIPAAPSSSVDAVVLTGGSAFGLAAADGVVRWCEERGLGFPTGAGPVPIVADPGALRPARGRRLGAPPGPRRATPRASRPSPAPSSWVGWAPAPAASSASGRGASTPAPAGSARRRSWPRASRSARWWRSTPSAIGGCRGTCACRSRPSPGSRRRRRHRRRTRRSGWSLTDARLTKVQCHLAAQSGHDGLARALDPAHTAGDGDALVVAATGTIEHDAAAPIVRSLAAYAVEAAVLDALDRAEAAGPRERPGDDRLEPRPPARARQAVLGRAPVLRRRRAGAGPGVPAARRGVRLPAPHALRRHPGADPRPGPVPRAGARPTACASRCAAASPSRRRW